MTCIIAHRLGWMVADRRVTFGESFIGPYSRQKIRRGPDLLFGTAGRASLGDLLAEAIESHDDRHRATQRIVATVRERGEGSNVLLLTVDGIVELDQRGSVCRVDADYWAIGSGYQAALGYLQGKRGDGTAVSIDDAISAIDYASTLNSDIGDGHQRERL